MSEPKTFDDWDMEMSKWRGYVVRALEDGNVELKEVKESINLLNEKIDKLNNRLTGIQIKVAGISATSGIIASIVLWLITNI